MENAGGILRDPIIHGQPLPNAIGAVNGKVTPHHRPSYVVRIAGIQYMNSKTLPSIYMANRTTTNATMNIANNLKGQNE